MAGSTVTIVRSHLVTLFETAAGSGVTVHYAVTAPEKLGHRFIACGGVEDAVGAIATIKAGRQRREEEYVLRWHCGVVGFGLSPEAADEAAVALVALVEETVADNGTLTGIATAADQQIIECVCDGWESAEGPVEDRGYGFEYIARVRVRARLL